jgi:chemotaxis protein MotA
MGTVLGIVVVYYAVLETGNVGLLVNFHGIAIVMGGVLAATLVNSDWKNLWGGLRGFFLAYLPPQNIKHEDLISRLTQLAQTNQREGLFSLHGELIDSDPAFIKSALDMATVSPDPGVLRANLEAKAENAMHNGLEASNLFRTMGIFAPMFGLIGTIFGVVRVLQNLTHPNAIGPSMALALSSALYGIILSNLLCIPIANKIRSRTLEMGTEHTITIEALVDMASGLSPAVIEAKLRGVYAEWMGNSASRPMRKSTGRPMEDSSSQWMRPSAGKAWVAAQPARS